jgi:TolA-binding protein
VAGLARLAGVAAVLASATGAGAADPPVLLPAPPLTSVLRLASPPLEKPQVALPALALPAPPEALPELPLPRLSSDVALRPMAAIAPPRVLACNPLGSVFGVVSEQIECGRARLQRGELEAARMELSAAAQRTHEREQLREARYWLAETALRLGRADEALTAFDQVAQDDPRGELGLFATHGRAWLQLERGDPARALAAFEALQRGSVPADIVPMARHGRAMALYGLGRRAEARDEWTALLTRSVPRPVATEATFWLGEVLGRQGDVQGAVERLQVFTAAGPHPLYETGLLRLAWYRRLAGQPLEAVKGLRGMLSAFPRAREAGWAQAGLVLSLLDLDDFTGAVAEARQLEQRAPGTPLVTPVWLAVAKWVGEKGTAEQASALVPELLARSLGASSRAFVLTVGGEAQRRAGQRAEAREQFELVRGAPSTDAVDAFAGLRLAEMELDAREFAAARAGAERLVRASSPELRAAALLIAAEAAYGAREFAAAADLYGRFAREHPQHPLLPTVSLAQAWAELRQGRAAEARAHFVRFADGAPSDPRSAPALLLAAELAADAGDGAGARALLERLLARFPDDARAEAAGLNRNLLLLRAGDAPGALRGLDELLARSPRSPFLGRIRLARGVALHAAGRRDDAAGELQAALNEGEEAARLGLGAVALERREWAVAERELAAARDAAPGAVLAAEYGLAAVAFNQGKRDEFRRFATALLAGPPAPGITAPLLEGTAVLAAEDKKWPEARAAVAGLVRDHAREPATPAALGAVGDLAAKAGEWAVARESYQLLADRYASTTSAGGGRARELDQAEALLRTGAVPDARRRLEAWTASAATSEPALPRALLLLAQAQEATGDRPAAQQTYARLRQDYPSNQSSQSATFAQGRLLLAEGKWAEAKPLLQDGLDRGDGAAAAEAAYLLGEGYRGAGQQQEAVESYLTSAYLAPDSAWARRALLGAGQSFRALKQPEAATIVLRKLLATKDIEPELAERARAELKAL